MKRLENTLTILNHSGVGPQCRISTEPPWRLDQPKVKANASTPGSRNLGGLTVSQSATGEKKLVTAVRTTVSPNAMTPDQ
jgi:hypothetical protein